MLGFESVLAGLFLLLLLWRAQGGDLSRLEPRRIAGPLSLVLAIVAALFAANLRDPFLSDDYILVSRAVFHWQGFAASLISPGGDGSFRPAGYLYFGLVHAWAGEEPWRWHVCSLALHLLNCALLYVVVQRLWPGWRLALAAALLFGLHGTRPEVVTWTAGSFDLLACTFTLMAALSAPRVAWLFVALAILSKESAYAAPLLVTGFAYAARRPLRGLLLSTGVTAGLLLGYRLWLFQGPGGYADPVTGRPRILSLHLLPVAKALLLRIWTILLFPVNWEAATALWMAVAGLVLVCGALGWILARNCQPRRIVVTLLILTAAAVLPAIHLALIGRSEAGSRILYLPSVAFCILCAWLVRNRPACFAALALGWGLMLVHNLGAWHRAAIAADRLCSAGVAGPVPGTREGVYFFANGFPECVAMKKAGLTAPAP